MPLAIFSAQASEERAKVRGRGELLLAAAISIFGATIQARQNGTHASIIFLDLALAAILLSLAASALHLSLHRLLRLLNLHRVLLRPATFFLAAAIVLLATTSISRHVKWVPLGIFLTSLFLLLCLRLLPAVSLVTGIEQLRRSKFVVFVFGPAAAHPPGHRQVGDQSPGNHDEVDVELGVEISSEPAAPKDVQVLDVS